MYDTYICIWTSITGGHMYYVWVLDSGHRHRVFRTIFKIWNKSNHQLRPREIVPLLHPGASTCTSKKCFIWRQPTPSFHNVSPLLGVTLVSGDNDEEKSSTRCDGPLIDLVLITKFPDNVAPRIALAGRGYRCQSIATWRYHEAAKNIARYLGYMGDKWGGQVADNSTTNIPFVWWGPQYDDATSSVFVRWIRFQSIISRLEPVWMSVGVYFCLWWTKRFNIIGTWQWRIEILVIARGPFRRHRSQGFREERNGPQRLHCSQCG